MQIEQKEVKKCFGEYNWKTNCLDCKERVSCLTLAKEKADEEYSRQETAIFI